MLIKVCGITREEEINALNEVDVDYIGFVFAESIRKVSIEKAKELYAALKKNIRVVGVFRNQSIEFVEKVLKEIPLDVVQLHGNEDEEFILRIKNNNLCDVWKAVSIKEKYDLIEATKYPVKTIVVDAAMPGSGKPFSWNIISGVNINKRIVLAGGLNEENVIEGIKLVNPDIVDVSSGVEIEDENGRRKSKDKIINFVRKVRGN